MQWCEVKYHSFHNLWRLLAFVKRPVSSFQVFYVVVLWNHPDYSAQSVPLQPSYLVAQTSPLNWRPAWNIISMSAPLLPQITVVIYMMQPVDRGSAKAKRQRKKMMYHCSGSCFLWTFPFTLMSAPKWQNKWGHLQYVHTSNVRWMKTQDLSRLLFVVVEAIPEEVIWPEPQRMDLCYRCLVKIASKSVIL